ncbi:DUF4271 domain-containing protein [Tenacibaculum sp. nBUS_03]|uniref:DUF4271 domain-containing protein n=1 Tax=Tenacibaculum sp. nBUS_03 TaxID=3395320 RepID=UPI003EB9A39B
MQAIELINNSDSWFTLVILFTIVLLAILKLIKPNYLLGYTLAFFTPGFFQKKAEEHMYLFSPFKFILFCYSSISISLLVYLVAQPSNTNTNSFISFLIILTYVFCYLLIKYFIENIIASILSIKNNINYFLHVKYGYLFTVSLWGLPLIILYKYSLHSRFFLITTLIILLIFRAFLIITNNKNIVIGKLFYFILYFCTLEIAPLLILYKTTTT